MTDPRTQADQLMRILEERFRAIVRQELRAKTGVVAGGPYTQFTVNSQGLVTWAGGLAYIVQLQFANLHEDTSEYPSAWDVVTDIESITAINADMGDGDFDFYKTTIPNDGTYRLGFTGSVTSNTGWIDGDVFQFLVKTNGTTSAVIAEITITADQPAYTDIPISGTLTVPLVTGDVVWPVFTWTNTLVTPTGARGVTVVVDDPEDEEDIPHPLNYCIFFVART